MSFIFLLFIIDLLTCNRFIMLKIIHICSDEKFIDSTIKQFDLINGVDSTFCAQTEAPSFKFIKSTTVLKFNDANKMIDFANKGHFDFAILHSLCYSPTFLNRLNIPVLWASWGFDIYSDYYDLIQKPISLSLYKPLSNKFAENHPKTIHDKIIVFLRKFGVLSKRQKEFNTLINKIPYISVVLEDEFEMIKKPYPHFKKFPFRYMGQVISKEDFQPAQISNKILLGNSLNPTNNHLDILKILEKRTIKCEVYIPISYPAGYKVYKDALKKYASELKYVTVFFMEDFIPKEEYFRIIDQCGVAIFGHIRQQAVGNISRMLLKGKKVFLYKDSIIYKSFTSLNYKLFSLEEDLNPSIFQSSLPIVDQMSNFQLIRDRNNYSTYIENLQQFFDSELSST